MHGSEDAGQSGLAAPLGAKATRRDWIGLAVLALPCILYSMDLTVLHLAVPQIAAALKPSSSALLWIVDIYGFMVAGALITMGTLGDRIGRRRLLLIGAAVFGLTSLLAAFSTSSEMLIVARALQGLAAATLAPSTLSLIRNMFHDPVERAFAIGVWVACFSAGAAAGPLVGGAILAHYWWGAVFIINVPIMLLLLAVGPLLLPEFRDPNAGRMDLAERGAIPGGRSCDHLRHEMDCGSAAGGSCLRPRSVSALRSACCSSGGRRGWPIRSSTCACSRCAGSKPHCSPTSLRCSQSSARFSSSRSISSSCSAWDRWRQVSGQHPLV